jgi:hypothetical protein
MSHGVRSKSPARQGAGRLGGCCHVARGVQSSHARVWHGLWGSTSCTCVSCRAPVRRACPTCAAHDALRKGARVHPRRARLLTCNLRGCVTCCAWAVSASISKCKTGVQGGDVASVAAQGESAWLRHHSMIAWACTAARHALCAVQPAEASAPDPQALSAKGCHAPADANANMAGPQPVTRQAPPSS